MRKALFLIILIILLSGCQNVKFWGSHAISSWTGLHREVKIYSNMDGKLLAEYETKSKIDWGNNSASLFNLFEKRIDIYGNFILIAEEK